MNQGTRPLGIVKEIIESIGLRLSYAYEDLVFIEGNPFIIRFDDTSAFHLFMHMNCDCNPSDSKVLQSHMKQQAQIRNFKVSVAERYYLEEAEGKEEISVVFVS